MEGGSDDKGERKFLRKQMKARSIRFVVGGKKQATEDWKPLNCQGYRLRREGSPDFAGGKGESVEIESSSLPGVYAWEKRRKGTNKSFGRLLGIGILVTKRKGGEKRNRRRNCA